MGCGRVEREKKKMEGTLASTRMLGGNTRRHALLPDRFLALQVQVGMITDS